MTTNKLNPLFRLTVKALKFFAFIVLGFTLAACLSNIIGAWHLTTSIFPTVFGYIWRSGIILLCFAGAAALIESFR